MPSPLSISCGPSAPAPSPHAARPLQPALQGQACARCSQLDIGPGQPHLVAAAARLLAAIEAELVVLDLPLADALAPHRKAREHAVALEHVTPVDIVGDLHAGELGT